MFKVTLRTLVLALPICLSSNASSKEFSKLEFSDLPYSAMLEANKGLRQFKQEKFRESIVSCTKSLSIYSKEVGYAGHTFVKRKSPQHQNEKKVLIEHDLNKQIMCIYLVRAQARVETEEYKQAISDFSRALEFKIEPVTALIGRATAWMALDNYDRAISDCSSAIELDPNDSDLLFFRAICWLQLADVFHALDDVEKAIKIDPNNEDLFLLRATCKKMRKDFADALKDYEHALAIEPTSIQGMCDLAELLSNCPDPRLLDLNRANKIMTSACVSSQWKEWEPIILLAKIQLKSGNMAKALATKKRALDIAPRQHRPVIEQLVITSLPLGGDEKISKVSSRQRNTESK